MIKYRNAVDTKGNIIEIEQVTDEDRHINKYYCIGCGDEMKAALGKKIIHYFSHKNYCNCSPESYYHNLAKRILRHKFDSSTQFPVKYYAHNDCPKATQCKLKDRHNWEGCSSVVLRTINLKDFYNTCKEEELYNGFKADLFFTHTEYPDRNPLFLEVAVTHNCTPEKINSKIRIIEIKIQNEDDIHREIIENAGEFINESNITISNKKELSPIRFYNFKRETRDEGRNPLSRLYILQDGAGRCYVDSKSKEIYCSDEISDHKNNSLLEVTISEEAIPKGFEFDLYDLGMALASEKGLDVKSCTLCNYFNRYKSLVRRSILAFKCIENKNSQSPKNQKFHLAWICRFYRYDDNRRKNIIDAFQSIPYDVWAKNG